MNHDYAHCLDYTKDCPKDCFRAQLQRDIEENQSVFIGVPLAYSHLGSTVECKLVREKKMNDLIRRQDAIDMFDGAKVDEGYFCNEYDIGYNDGIDFAVSKLSVLKPAQPEIVWCKDCEHWYTEEDDQYGYCRNHDFWTSDIWFCADGDRRET